jgi:hypothetical protein
MHEPQPVHDFAGELMWTVHAVSIERLGNRRATAPEGYSWLYGWRSLPDGESYDLGSQHIEQDQGGV